MMIGKSAWFWCVVLMSFGFLLTSSAFAKGIFEQIIITDQKTGNAIQLFSQDSHSLMRFFLFDFTLGALEAVPPVGEGYAIQRGYLNNEQFSPFDMVVYYPAVGNQRGYIHYVGLLGADGQEVGGWSEYDNRWYYVDQSAEIELQALLRNDAAFYPGISTWRNGLFDLFKSL